MAPRKAPSVRRCGRQRHVEYKTHHNSVSSTLGKEYGAPLCLYLERASLAAVVVDACLRALPSAELDGLDAILAAQQADHARLAQQEADQVILDGLESL